MGSRHQPRGSRPLRATLWAVGAYLVAYLGWQAFRWGGTSLKELIGDLAFVPVYGGAAAASWSAARRCHDVPRLRSAWRLIAIGVSFYLAGVLIQAYYEVFAASKPYPSLADPAYLMLYPFVLAGLLRFPHPGESGGTRVRALIDCAIVAVAGGAVVWYAVLGPATLTRGTVLETVVSVAAPVGDLVLMGALSTALLRRTVPSSDAALRWLAAGLVSLVAAELVYGWASLHSSYSGGDPVDFLYLLALSLFLIGAAAQGAPAADDVRVASTRSRTSWLPWLGVVLVFTLLGVAERHHSFVPIGGLLLSAAGVTGLVAIRQIVAQRQLIAAHRELERAHAELERAHAELAALATTDPVTLLLNHRALIAAVDREISRSARLESPCAVVFLDVDHFKLLNDRFGHAAGDSALRDLGALARTTLRVTDMVGRWGGEEFVAVLPDTSRAEARLAAERLRSAIAAHSFCGDAEVRLTCSLGVAIYPEDGCSRAALIDAADRAMYTAKRFGRNQTFVADDPAVGALDDDAGSTADGNDLLADTVEALAVLVDERDSYTDTHATSVSELARRVAVELTCDSDAVATVVAAARLHDIGKVAVPDAILMKRGRLTDDEWCLMRKHPVVGADVLSRISALRAIAPVVRAHHERWDGHGYPDGLAREEIPLAARVIAAADAFDAMVAGRPYREAIDPDSALAEIRRCSGTQFDPRVVAAMERALETGVLQHAAAVA